MPLFFDAQALGDPKDAYVTWVDVMGIQGALKRSISVAANFVYKMHDAALQSATKGIRVYPVMDGVYACAEDGPEMERFVRSVFHAAAEDFVAQRKNMFRFIVKGAVAFGKVYYGADLRRAANTRLADKPEYRDCILLGTPMVSAHLGESEAPPFGLYVEPPAKQFRSRAPYPFDRWWRWYTTEDTVLVRQLRDALVNYYDWCWEKHESISYPRPRIRIHRGQATLYLQDVIPRGTPPG